GRAQSLRQFAAEGDEARNQPGRSCPSAISWASFSQKTRQMFRLDVGQLRVLRVLQRQDGLTDTPLDCNVGITPKDSVLVARSIIIAALIEKLHALCQGEEAVRKSRWDINLILLFCREPDTRPLAKVRRADADIDDHVQSFALDHTTEFCLR